MFPTGIVIFCDDKGFENKKGYPLLSRSMDNYEYIGQHINV